MNELSLFTGAGGGIYGSILLGWRTIGYVECDDYCQRVIRQRIEDGIFDDAPIFGDVRAFISEGYAEAYQGMVDVITAGFPCQPFSVAGKRRGEDDERNMWPATRECLRIVRPRYALLENVPGLLAHEYAQQILWDLASLGYVGRYDCIPASAVGAPHQRDRLWIGAELARALADADKSRLEGRQRRSMQERSDQRVVGSGCSWWDEDPADVGDSERPERSPQPLMGRVANGVAKKLDIP